METCSKSKRKSKTRIQKRISRLPTIKKNNFQKTRSDRNKGHNFDPCRRQKSTTLTLGKNNRAHSGKDGVVRVVKLKTVKRYLLYSLEITKEREQFIAESAPVVADIMDSQKEVLAKVNLCRPAMIEWRNGVVRLVKLKTVKRYLLYSLEITKEREQFIAESTPVVVEHGQPERSICESIPVQTRYGRVAKPLVSFQP
ncbi:hypothetical protein AVEN_272604-1 [Araneus ventricosus]|uniref:DUF5641 domain-containing protein n=1 Tax=Araneus ventricosus TaxID=182803 RepID=A0A4Y2GIW1_ARAVE|nr:hypothetical protein AVEN_272604-1 [Araneus ventricosus]